MTTSSLCSITGFARSSTDSSFSCSAESFLEVLVTMTTVYKLPIKLENLRIILSNILPNLNYVEQREIGLVRIGMARTEEDRFNVI